MTQNILRGNVSTILRDFGRNAQDRNPRRSRDDNGISLPVRNPLAFSFPSTPLSFTLPLSFIVCVQS